MAKRKLGARNAYNPQLNHRSVEAGCRPQGQRAPAAAWYLEMVAVIGEVTVAGSREKK